MQKLGSTLIPSNRNARIRSKEPQVPPHLGGVYLWFVVIAGVSGGLANRAMKNQGWASDKIVTYILAWGIGYGFAGCVHLCLKRFVWYHEANNSERVRQISIGIMVFCCTMIPAVAGILSYLR